MKVTEHSEDRLVLTDSQLDKKLAIGIASAILLFMAYQFASGGTRDDLLIALVPLSLVAGMGVYLWKTLLTSVFTFDRPSGQRDTRGQKPERHRSLGLEAERHRRDRSQRSPLQH